jgi:hypothetical protein
VGDGVGFFFARDFDHALGDERSGDAGAEKILALVNRASLDHRENKIAREFFAEVVDVKFRCAGFHRLFVETFEFFLLADVGAERDDFRVVFFFEPQEEN